MFEIGPQEHVPAPEVLVQWQWWDQSLGLCHWYAILYWQIVELQLWTHEIMFWWKIVYCLCQKWFIVVRKNIVPLSSSLLWCCTNDFINYGSHSNPYHGNFCTEMENNSLLLSLLSHHEVTGWSVFQTSTFGTRWTQSRSRRRQYSCIWGFHFSHGRGEICPAWNHCANSWQGEIFYLF